VGQSLDAWHCVWQCEKTQASGELQSLLSEQFPARPTSGGLLLQLGAPAVRTPTAESPTTLPTTERRRFIEDPPNLAYAIADHG
jgi:hypothetical protein